MKQYKDMTAEDVEYWGLTWRQAFDYRMRLVRYHSERADSFRDEAIRYAVKARLVLRIALVAQVIGVLLALAAVAMGVEAK